MITFILRRLLQGLVVVWGVVTIVFLLRFISPNDPAELVAPANADKELVDAIRQELGLDQPMYVQYTEYLLNLVQGDLGYAYNSSAHVSALLIERLPATMELAVASLALALVVSIPLGVYSANNKGSKKDAFANGFSLLGLSTPNFWLGIMLVMIISVGLGILPTSNRVSPSESLVGWAKHMILPTFALGTYFIALLFRMTRNTVIEEMNKNHIKAARAKGLYNYIIYYRYILQNSIAPVITVTGLQFGTLVGGSVVIETVFDWPGVGTLFIQSINNGDWPIVQGTLIVVGIAYVLINLSVDIMNSKINPEVELS